MELAITPITHVETHVVISGASPTTSVIFELVRKTTGAYPLLVSDGKLSRRADVCECGQQQADHASHQQSPGACIRIGMQQHNIVISRQLSDRNHGLARGSRR